MLTASDNPQIPPTATQVDDTQLTSPRPAVLWGKVETSVQGGAGFVTTRSPPPTAPADVATLSETDMKRPADNTIALRTNRLAWVAMSSRPAGPVGGSSRGRRVGHGVP